MESFELPLAPVHRIIKNAGAERVSESASRELRKGLEELSIEVAKDAIKLAEHDGRKTVKARDIALTLAMKTSRG